MGYSYIIAPDREVTVSLQDLADLIQEYTSTETAEQIIKRLIKEVV